MPGAGKSTLGQALAKLFSIPFIDLDHEISKVAGLSIPEIFASQGEVHFRQLEADVLRKQTEASFVMATGGGTPCFHENMMYMNSTGIVVFLDVPSDVIVKRLMDAGNSGRPLLAVQDEDELRNRIYKLLIDRLPYYHAAPIQISSESVKPEEIQRAITNFLKK